ncbi:ABC transporter substrate-binding protein [Oculatella sp. LEGE 06141]|uniref:ABC transporter substrate-binding protein n=1 Tax=Oculatella sp. LEGE 06141 TaxID=1828648 RepID=UPI00187FE0D4|nr:ABC transporter substrate-binding protein [Oculatella sp. LEGE 06141]MBE9182502.1 ABC transporter substrate-binding protein [Oculatella sp. LEGE 06141]
MSKLLKRTVLLIGLFTASLCLIVACNSQQASVSNQSSSAQSLNQTKPLVVGVPLWPGFGAQYVAHELKLFQEEGLEVQEVFFPVQSDSNTALLTERVDLVLTGVPDLITMASREPSLRLIMLCDYSNGSDGILGRNITQPEDLRGKTVARENLLIEILLLRRYLEQGGLTEDDINILTMPAADAATAFASKRVDVAVTWEPFLTRAAEEGDGEIIFTTEDTNIIPDGFVTRDAMIQNRRPELLAYLRSIDKAVALIESRDQKAVDVIAKRLGVTPEEALPQMDGVRYLGIQGNKDIVFNAEHPMNIFDSLQFAAQTAQDINLTPTLVDVNTLSDDSLLNEL